MKLMHLFYLTGVGCLFLCYATDANVTDCKQRILTATVDDEMRLFIDGIEITNLSNWDNWEYAKRVDLPCNATVLAIQGKDRSKLTGGVLASTDDGYILTNSSWKCTNTYFDGWQTIGFNDSDWPPAFETFIYECYPLKFLRQARRDAVWIWTRECRQQDYLVYCRKNLGITHDVNECDLGPPDNECDPSMGKCNNFLGGYNCSCNEGYVNAGNKRCEDVDECAFDYAINKCGSATGNCVNLPGSYRCSCHQGYNNFSTQPPNVSTGNDTTSPIILGILFGVSVLANIALVSALLILHSRNKAVRNEGQSDKGTYQKDIAVRDDQSVFRSSPVAEDGYDNLKFKTLSRDQLDGYEKLQIK